MLRDLSLRDIDTVDDEETVLQRNELYVNNETGGETCGQRDVSLLGMNSRGKDGPWSSDALDLPPFPLSNASPFVPIPTPTNVTLTDMFNN